MADEFLEFCLARDVLRFGEFTLKSGGKSPYFFNAGLFNTGASIAELGRHYADAIVRSGVEFDVLFGPAYKGIPLVTATAVALSVHHGKDVPWCYNRKEAKDHGEGGSVVGAPLAGRVLVVDDVITAGTAIREAVEIIRGQGATLTAVVVSLDRQERGPDGSARSAIQEVEVQYGVRVVSLASLDALVAHLEKKPGTEMVLTAMRAYRGLYGVQTAPAGA